ncbi:MAG: M1 family metallopeptidase [Anaerolineae bacterium]|nr:M1 family metallopeptidase [Anaerolineae bacterium]
MLPFFVLVVVLALIGLTWSMANMLTRMDVVTVWTHGNPPRVPATAPQAEQPAPAPIAAQISSLDSTLSLYKPALRSPFMADLARHANAPRYEVDWVLDVSARQITGKQTLRYTNQTTQPLNDLVLRLYPNTRYMGGEMTLGELKLGEMQTPWSWALPDQSALRIGLLKSITPGETVTLSLSFTLSVPNGARGAGYQTFGLFNGLWALPNAYAMIAPRAIDLSDQWQVDAAPNYGDIVFSEMALYRVSLHAPSNYNVVATGACQSDEATPMATTTCVAGPVRDFALHLSERYDVERTTVNSLIGEPVKLFSYFLPQHRAAGKRALEIAAHALGSFEQRFGPYPYGELKILRQRLRRAGSNTRCWPACCTATTRAMTITSSGWWRTR